MAIIMTGWMWYFYSVISFWNNRLLVWLSSNERNLCENFSFPRSSMRNVHLFDYVEQNECVFWNDLPVTDERVAFWGRLQNEPIPISTSTPSNYIQIWNCFLNILCSSCIIKWEKIVPSDEELWENLLII